VPGYCYHIYNRANSDHNLFFVTANFSYFLQQYAHYLDRYLETFAYCLLPNHFHLLVRIRSTETIFEVVRQMYERPPRNLIQSINSLSDASDQPYLSPTTIGDFRFLKELPIDVAAQTAALFVSNQFRKLFMSYSKAVNNQRNRRGALFQKPFKRKNVSKHLYLKWMIWYIHRNPVHHGVHENFRSYPWSSYRSMLSNRPTRLARTEVLSWFDEGLIGFKEYHDFGEVAWDNLSRLTLE
jgi:REP element-mobilizing transposase RayT